MFKIEQNQIRTWLLTLNECFFLNDVLLTGYWGKGSPYINKHSDISGGLLLCSY